MTLQLELQQIFFSLVLFSHGVFLYLLCCIDKSRGRALLEDREEIWVETSSGIRDSPFDPQAH